eukprot:NODE_2653_length_2172_cov_4.606357.p1 GENE.NODE_2653_length_2172_cov_4.606357~~NODE_2653_length_2172_cov_4.606357.p1  ORF type:complete len:628 (-),score=208.31 NODE_2653_length_2172_cov_4.606357:209-2092(-)
MLRFAPAGAADNWRGKASAASPQVRSVGGDELNVCVALANLGRNAAWVSVLPSGPLGDVIRTCAADAGVCLKHVTIDEGGEVGCFHLLPERRAVHFQRKNSSFALQQPGVIDWPALLAERASDGGARVWLHVTGITPMLGAGAAENWRQGICAAHAAGHCVSLDFNHRPQLGSFETLWAIVEPQLPRLVLLVLSTSSVLDFAKHYKVPLTDTDASRNDGGVQLICVLRVLQSKLGGPAVACCCKRRSEDGVQRRWSVIIDAGGTYTTRLVPTTHTPKDECGGGSAWAAGVIDRLAGEAKSWERGSTTTFGSTALAATRRGDLLAALAQETIGDHCTATRAELDDLESRHAGVAASVPAAGVAAKRPSPADGSDAVERPAKAARMGVLDASAEARITNALKHMDACKVVAILRAKFEKRAVERASELAELGFTAIEVTTDSAGFKEGTLLPAVARAVGDRCLVGIGTVTTLAQLEIAARGGARFALSPVRPSAGWGTTGFVGECHARGIVAVPAACSPQEIYECVEQYGARAVKLFPAQLWSPSSLSDLRRIGDFGKYRICPSGGIDCSTVESWLAVGASAVGMGSCLVGKDVATPPGDTKALEAAEKDWATKGRKNAADIAQRLKLR